MSRKIAHRLRLGLLLLAILFTLAALLQYHFTRSQLMKHVASQLEAYVHELQDELVVANGWDMTSFRQATPAAPDYYIVAKDGLIIEAEGFVPGLLPKIAPLGWAVYDRPATITSSIGERWALLAKKVRGGTVILGIQASLRIRDAGDRLRVSAEQFGSTLADALRVRPRQIDGIVDYAVLDELGEPQMLVGGVPLTLSPAEIAATPSGGSLVRLRGEPYYMLSAPLLDTSKAPAGTIVVFKDVAAEHRLLRYLFAFDATVAAICWIISGGLFALHLRDRGSPHLSCEEAYASDEGQTIEFKSSLRWDYAKQCHNREIEAAVVKTVAAFLNTDGGVLLIGVSDGKEVVGLEADYETVTRKPNRDGWELSLQQALTNAFGSELYARNVRVGFCRLGDKDVCIVTVRRSRRRVFVQEATPSGRAETLYVRVGNSSKALSVKEALTYAEEHWGV